MWKAAEDGAMQAADPAIDAQPRISRRISWENLKLTLSSGASTLSMRLFSALAPSSFVPSSLEVSGAAQDGQTAERLE
jgi:hypothetical protein